MILRIQNKQGRGPWMPGLSAKWVDSFLEAKPHLRAGDFKPGAGTSKVPAKSDAKPNAITGNGEKKDYQTGAFASAAMEAFQKEQSGQ